MTLPQLVTMIRHLRLLEPPGFRQRVLAPHASPEFLTNAFNGFLLRQFFRSINLELDDAVRIDGAGVGLKVCGRRSRAPVASSKPQRVLAIMAFTWNWNNFLKAGAICFNEPRGYTVAIVLEDGSKPSRSAAHGGMPWP